MTFTFGYYFFTRRIHFRKITEENSVSKKYINTLFVIWVVGVVSDVQGFLFSPIGSINNFLFVLLNLPIGIFFLILFNKNIKPNKKIAELDNILEKKVINYLKSNTGKAYTSKALLTRIEADIKNSSLKKYFKKNGEEILKKLTLDSRIEITEKEEEKYYLLLND